MWNPFKKSKEKQLKEVIASATLDYLKDKLEEETRNKLKNENINDKKLYELLESKAKIHMTEMYSPKDVIGFFGDYKYDIRRTENVEYLEFIIDGKFYRIPRDFTEPRYVLINIGDKDNNVSCYGVINFRIFTNGKEDIETGLVISVPIKELDLSEINK